MEDKLMAILLSFALYVVGVLGLTVWGKFPDWVYLVCLVLLSLTLSVVVNAINKESDRKK